MVFCRAAPLSASLFVIAMNPFLLDLQQTLVDKSYGVLYACADDLGGALLRITSLLILHRVFDVMAKVSGLVLQTLKCVIVPLVAPNHSIFKLYKTWPSHKIPQWANCKVAAHAEYLGFEISPGAGSCQWDKVLEASQAQVAAVSHSGAPPPVAVFFL